MEKRFNLPVNTFLYRISLFYQALVFCGGNSQKTFLLQFGKCSLYLPANSAILLSAYLFKVWQYHCLRRWGLTQFLKECPLLADQLLKTKRSHRIGTSLTEYQATSCNKPIMGLVDWFVPDFDFVQHKL
jgi:hypothetical protein